MFFKARLGLGVLVLTALAPLASAATVADPCAGILSLVNRPSVADSACAVPYKEGLIESGLQFQNVKGGHEGYNLPEMELRIGLPYHNEFTVFLPNYTHQNTSPRAGFASTTLGLKHELGYTSAWLGAVEALFTLPSGSAAYGSDGLGATANAIVEYAINSRLSFLFMLGLSSQTQSFSADGQRFNTVNPDAVLTWQLRDDLLTYGEVYGQSRTGPGQGAGFNADAGFMYELTKHLVGDIEVGQRISGQLAQYGGLFNNYLGLGLSFLL